MAIPCAFTGSMLLPRIRSERGNYLRAPSRNCWRRFLTEIPLAIAAGLILIGVVFAMIRLAIGPESVDRIAALDLLGIITISLIALYAHLADRFIYLDAALVYGLLDRKS